MNADDFEEIIIQVESSFAKNEDFIAFGLIEKSKKSSSFIITEI